MNEEKNGQLDIRNPFHLKELVAMGVDFIRIHIEEYENTSSAT
jgi:hypothetical protein